MKGTGSVVAPLMCTSTWLWHPVDGPVEPTSAMSCPAETCCPVATRNPPLTMWPYAVWTPPPWLMRT